MTRSNTQRPCCCCKNWCPECNLPRCKPTQETAYAPGTLNTEYLDKYPEKKGIRGSRTALPGKEYVESTARLDDRTTNRTDFTPKAANRLHPKMRDSPMPNMPFDGQTTYGTYHNGKTPLPSDRAKKPHDPYSAPFDGVTSNRADYVDWGVKTPPEAAPKYNLVSLPFEGTSTYQSDFLKKSPLPRDPRAKAPVLQSSNRDNYTTYAVDYVPQPFAPSSSKTCCAEKKHTGLTVRLTECTDRGVPC